MPDRPDIHLFANLRDRDLRREGLCVGEGLFVVERMLRADWEVLGILCAERMASRAKAIAKAVPVLVKPEQELKSIAGFPFHRGMLAVAKRPPFPGLGQVFNNIEGESAAGRSGRPDLVIVCPTVSDPENLGSVYRSAATFGASAVVVGNAGADPFSRRVIRVSMGGVFAVNTIECGDPEETKGVLAPAGYTLVAAVVDPTAESLGTFRWPERSALVLGGELDGLDSEWRAVCAAKATIPMSGSTDSLNLGVAAGIFMYSCTSFSAGSDLR